MEQGVRMIALGNPEGSDKASQLIAIASSLGLKSSIVTSDPGENFESFNHGAIDWKEKMAMAHWVVNSTSMVTAGPSPAMAWSASMTFAELEGCRNVMIVDMPSDPESISMVWGQVIEKVRQIHVLFFTSGSLTGFAFFLDGGFAAASAARLSARAFVWTMEPSRERERRRVARPSERQQRAREAALEEQFLLPDF